MFGPLDVRLYSRPYRDPSCDARMTVSDTPVGDWIRWRSFYEFSEVWAVCFETFTRFRLG